MPITIARGRRKVSLSSKYALFFDQHYIIVIVVVVQEMIPATPLNITSIYRVPLSIDTDTDTPPT